jgi:hypothetical protein
MGKNLTWVANFYNLADWVKQLYGISDEIWFQPIKDGKWSIAEIISHLEAWDRFILEERLFKLEQDGDLFTPIEDEVNQSASRYAKSGVGKETVINRLIQSREAIIEFMEAMDSNKLETPLNIGDRSFVIKDYITDLTDHDAHHVKQIEEFLDSVGFELTKYSL